MQKWQYVLILGWKHRFGQTRALWWKKQKRVAPSGYVTKRADLGLKTLFCTNSCTLLKIANMWCAQCKNDKTCWSLANNTVLLFGQTGVLCSKELKSGAPSAKLTIRAGLGLKTLFRTNWGTLLKIAKNWCAQCESEETCWSRAENAVLKKLMPFAENG